MILDKKIVIIGAGYAGVLTAKKLEKYYRKNDGVSIIIIDKNPFHTMLTELHEVAANRVDEESIKMGLKKIFSNRKVTVKQDTVEGIDFENKTVKAVNESYNYDYLVIAAGSKPEFFEVSGAKEFAFKLWSYNDAVILREHIHNCFRKAAVTTSIEERKRLLSFYVVGAGFTGVEMAGELAEYIPILCEKHEIDRRLVSINIIEYLERAVSFLPQKLSEKAEKRLKKMGVNLMLETKVTGIGKGYIEISHQDKTTHQNCNTVIWAAGIQSATITLEAAKTLESEGRGRIKVDKYLRAIGKEDIYIIGDNMFYIPEGDARPVPQMVENCEQSAQTAAKNIICAVSGKGKMEEYKPKFHGMMVSIGGRYGVARVGLPGFMFNLPSFFAMFTKHFINIVYFIQVLGLNKVISYLKHEFFTIRNRRSFVGGHFSNRTPSFLLVPLRIWLGGVWLFEGIRKIFEGWLFSPKLTDFFGSSNAWYNSILSGIQANPHDSLSSATGAADAAAGSGGSVLFNLNFGLFKTIFVSSKELIQSTFNDFAFKLDVPLVNWFVENIIDPNDSLQIVLQAFIVVSEILIGLALIAGLFTTLSSGFSLVLNFLFVTTTGLYLNTMWMIFAAVAVLIGGGRTFGLDYYFMPYIKRFWKGLPFVRRLYIYND